MTSVADVVPVHEPVSPELALVDPILAARLRALLPEIELQIGLEPDPTAPTLRVLPDPEPDNVLPLRPPPELVDEAVAAPAPPVAAVVVPPLFPSRADRWRALAKSFAAGAAVATFVTVGVIAKLGEGKPEQPAEPDVVPPRAAPAAAGAAAGSALSGKPATGTPGAAPSGKPATGTPAATGPKRGAAAQPKPVTKAESRTSKAGSSRRAEKRAAQQKAKAKAAAKTSAAQQRAATAGQKTKSKLADNPEHARTGKYPKATPVAPAPRRFAWAPVDGAVGYRIELFRGTKQVLEERTTDPVYELVSPWRHSGRTETLTSGSYRWYVWPVFSSGAADRAVVQAQLRVP